MHNVVGSPIQTKGDERTNLYIDSLVIVSVDENYLS